MGSEQEKDRIEYLKRGLYSRSSQDITNREVPKINKLDYSVKTDWLAEDTPHAIKRGRFAKWFLIFSLGFFVLAILFAGLMFWKGDNTIYANNINIAVLGPVAVSGGDTVTLEIAVANGNSVALDNTVLGVEFPQGARSVDNVNTELVRSKDELGTIDALATTKRTVKAVLYGEKDAVKEFTFKLDYRIKGSNATFSKEKKYSVAITSAPIVMDVVSPKEVGTGDSFALTLNISSNSNVPISNLLVTVDYPFGFTYTKSNPDVSYSKNTWLIKELAPGAKKQIKIEGRLEAQDNEERTFRFHAGNPSERDEKIIGIDFVTAIAPVLVSKPLLGVDLVINGSSADTFVVGSSQKINASVNWANNLTTKIVNPKIEVRLQGSALDRNAVETKDGGFFRSSDNTLVWDKSTNTGFTELAPGDRGSLGFEFATLSLTPGRTSSRNQEILADVYVVGTRLDEGGVNQTVSVKTTKKIKIATNISVSGKSLYSIGGFKNSGPLPLQAEKETTFTLLLQVANNFNNVSNASLRATLPSYVRWLGKILPTDESVQYDENTRSILWNVGNVGAGAGFTTGARQVAIQVAIIPSLSQVGTAPALLSDISVAGTDAGTGLNVEAKTPNITTLFISDPLFGDGLDKVVQ